MHSSQEISHLRGFTVCLGDRHEKAGLTCAVRYPCSQSLNAALVLKLRIKHLSAAQWQPALLPGTQAQLTPLGWQRMSTGENKLQLDLITRNNILGCIFLLPILSLFLPFVVWWFLHSWSSFQLWHVFPICYPLTLSLAFFPALFFFLSPFPLFLPFLVLLSLALLQSVWNGIHSTWLRMSSVAT